jgi:hypothetical protein
MAAHGPWKIFVSTPRKPELAAAWAVIVDDVPMSVSLRIFVEDTLADRAIHGGDVGVCDV